MAKAVFDADSVITKVQDQRHPLTARLFVAFIFVMNCRPQDMFALRWSDVDLVNGLVTFGYTAKRVKGGDWEVRQGTKTGLYDGIALPLGSLLTGMLNRMYSERKTAGKASPHMDIAQRSLEQLEPVYRRTMPPRLTMPQ